MTPKDKKETLFEDGAEGYAAPEMAPVGDNNPNVSDEAYDLDQEQPASDQALFPHLNSYPPPPQKQTATRFLW